MHKPLYSYVFRLEYAVAALLVMLGVRLLLLLSSALPEADETSYLNPVLDRIDFLNIEDVSLDAVFAIRETEGSDPRIKVVNIGEVAPAPDAKIAMLLYRLHDLGARVIGIDVILDAQHVERFGPERQQEPGMLAQAIASVPNVVLVSTFDEEARTPVFPLDSAFTNAAIHTGAATHQGFANLFPDADGVIRRFLPSAMIEDSRWLSWPVRILQLYEPQLVEHLLQQPEAKQIIAYTGGYYDFSSVPIDDVLFTDRYDNGFFEDGIVLIGFVNEGGLFYLGDTHRTPMGKKAGIIGPDMPGVLLHANIVDMLLRGRSIASVPAWVDWLLVFLLSYMSLAVYRVLRTRPRGKSGAILLVTSMLFTEAVLVFFIPLLAFFYLDVKISYNLMATAVLLFIPAGSTTSWLRVRILHARLHHRLRASLSPLALVLRRTFMDDEEFPLRLRLEHSCLYLLHTVYGMRLAELLAAGQDLPPASVNPGLDEMCARIGAVAARCSPDDPQSDEAQRRFYRYLFQRKEELLRDAWLKNELFSAHLDSYNPHHAWEEWDVMLPYAIRLWRRDIADDISRMRNSGFNESISNSAPFLTNACCKVHGIEETFVYAGVVRRQRHGPAMPVYYGMDVQCEPVLDGETQRMLARVGLLQLHTTSEEAKS